MTSWHEVITRNGSQTGILKKCASDPCNLHNGSDFSIASDNPADAYAYYYQHSPAAFTPGMMGQAVQTAQIKGYVAKKKAKKRIRKSVRRTKWKMRKAIRRSKKRLKAKMKAKAKNLMLKPVRSLKSKYKRLPLEKRMLVNLGGLGLIGGLL